MRLTLAAAGTEGDVLPFLALAHALQGAGHAVRVATHPAFQDAVTSRGLGFAPLPGDPRGALASRASEIAAVRPWKPVAHATTIRVGMAELLGAATPDDHRAACADAEAVLFTLPTAYAGTVAHELGLPAIGLSATPFHRTRAFAHPVLAGGARLGPLLAPLTYPPSQKLLGEPLAEPLRGRARRAAGLPVAAWPWRAAPAWPPVPVLHTYSPALAPRPADWPAQLRVTGHLPSPAAEGGLAAEVEAFLDAGPPPVYVGFGSMPDPDPAATAELVVAASRAAGRRVILGSGWSGIGAGTGAADDVLVVDHVPHDLLFPRTAGVVHHGGSGTTVAGLRAGRPTAVVPFVFDQAFWGRCVHRAGAGPAPLPRRRLTATRLTRALRQLGEDRVRAAADALGARMRQEAGPATAAAAVDELLAAGGR